jgi:hypothetical protein
VFVALSFSFSEIPTATNGTAGRSAKSKRGSGKLHEANRRYQRARIDCVTYRTSFGPRRILMVGVDRSIPRRARCFAAQDGVSLLDLLYKPHPGNQGSNCTKGVTACVRFRYASALGRSLLQTPRHRHLKHNPTQIRRKSGSKQLQNTALQFKTSVLHLPSENALFQRDLKIRVNWSH